MIKSFTQIGTSRTFERCFPNLEVENSFLTYLAPVYAGLDRSAEEALKQIDEKGYATKYDLAHKRVVKIGVAFSSEKRTITDVLVDG